MKYTITESHIESEDFGDRPTYGLTAVCEKTGDVVYSMDDISVEINDLRQLIKRLEQNNTMQGFIHYEVLRFIGSI